jgi:hypothetical protein
MIARRILQASKSVLKGMNLFKNVPFKTFATSNSLKDIVKQEIDHEEKNYEAVSAEDKNTFLSNSGFSFAETANSTLMTLKKTKGNYEITVNFQARPPAPSNDEGQEGQQDGDQEKSI